MIQGTNTLLLDDPTNHLDMESITALNNALMKFPGVILMESHDYQLLNSTVNRVISINADGSIQDYLGTYEEFIESK